jgi:FKBP-type peptidyl-prolyl cis-trans isomerase FklB
MKPVTHRNDSHLARHGFGLLLMLAVTPFGLAQTSPPPATPPGAPAAGAPAAPAPAAPQDTSVEHTSYLFGLTFAEQMHAVGISNQVDVDAITRGVKDGLQGKKSTRADQQQIQDYVRSIMVAAAEHNKAAGQEFLAKNGKEKAVKTTASGLQYKVLAAGDAKAPVVLPTDQVTVNYRGKLLDGTEFDSSYTRGTPATFTVNGVIKGWQEALVLMKPGAKWQLFIPADLAYGDKPRPGIPAGSLLIFDVELLSAKAAGASPPNSQAMPPNHPGIPAPAPQPPGASQPPQAPQPH